MVLGNGNGSAIVDSPRNAVDLLAEFKLTGRQEAFEEVVRRYAAMVFGVCLKTTRNAHDAEDATQAVFLNLAVHCKTNDQAITYVGPWLQKVARRVSLDIRRSKKRREVREETHATTNSRINGNGNGHVDGGQEGVDVEELKVILNEELHQLPAKYRLPMILHYFGGLSREEMAKELGCKPSTLGVRIHRGRQMLAQRLSERGASLGHLSLGLALTLSVRSAVSDGIIVSTSKAAADLMAGSELGAMISSHVLAFSHGAAGAAMIAKVKTVAAIVVIAALTLLGAAGAVAKVVPLDELKRQWQGKLQGIFRIPRLQSPFSPPQANAADAPGALELAARSLATDAVVETVLWMGETPAEGGRPRMRPGVTASRPRHGIGSAGRVVAQFVSTVISSNLSAGGSDKREPAGPVYAAGQGANSAVAAAAPVPAVLPPHRDHRLLAGGVGGDGPVNGLFAGGVARASGDVTLGSEQLVYPLLPPARMSEWLSGGGTGAARGGGEPVLARGPSMVIGGAPGSRGSVEVDHGTLAVDHQVIGDRGSGQLSQLGGTNIARAVRLGVGPGGKGIYDLRGNRLLIKGDDASTLALAAGGQLSGIEIGHDGAGEFNIGDGLSMGEISEYGPYGPLGGSLVVRGGQPGTGVLRGTGRITLHGYFDHNGRVIADGYGTDRTLEFSGFRYVGNSYDNPAHGGTNGWFAQDHGQLILPNLRIHAGTGTYTWGEDPTDPTIDLVNSVRLTVHDAAKDGPVRISLVSKDRLDVPTLPTGHNFIGIWKFEDGGLPHGAVDLLVRYDDGLAEQLGLNENNLKLWRYSDGQWIRINDATFSRDVELNLIGGTAADAFTYFAVSAPEPATAAVLLFGGGALLLRRRPRTR
jgi:RNA polymerase sigma factor (sigma-70 family)